MKASPAPAPAAPSLPDAPRVSVVIPSRADEPIEPALERLARTSYPADRIEVWHATGNQPSVQRNRCATRAGGEWLYFLDSDSLAQPPGGAAGGADTLSVLVAEARRHGAAIAGGPSLTPPDDSPFQQAAGLVLGSAFGTGGIRLRYRAVGPTRATDQFGLILCNMLMERALFLELGGFNESLYPNEENDLMHRAAERGARILYVPGAPVHRSQRPTVRRFARQMWTYGRGRAEQTRANPSSFSPSLLAPVAFLVYAATVLPLARWAWPVLLRGTGLAGSGAWLSWLPWLPALLYAAANLAASAAAAATARRGRTAAWLPGLFLLTHLAYPAGFLAGLARRRPPPARRPPAEVSLRQVKGFGDPFPRA